MSNGLLNASGLTTPKITTEEIILKDKQGHFVIETWKEGSEWYRKYSDGWVEQGGIVSAPSISKISNFYVPFIDTNYTILATPRVNGNFWQYPACVHPDTPSTFRHGSYSGSDSLNMNWFACGYMATNL